MAVEYDHAKATANFKAHGISFQDAEGVFFDPLAVTIDDPEAMDERRFITIGRSTSGELIVVISTERDGRYRLISARRPTRKERKSYEG